MKPICMKIGGPLEHRMHGLQYKDVPRMLWKSDLWVSTATVSERTRLPLEWSMRQMMLHEVGPRALTVYS